MPIIAYQSFNSNSSTSHGVEAFSFQRFTKLANSSVTNQGVQALVLPSNPSNLVDAIEGPANLMDIEQLTDTQPVTAFGGQISLIGQNLVRALGSIPDILVLGEMDSSHSEFSKIVNDKNVVFEHVSMSKACQSFTAISPVQNQAKIGRICFDEGYVVYKVFDFIVIFVHVPNRIATSKSQAASFYHAIIQHVQSKGGVVHLVIGDTNQPSIDFTADVLNSVDPLGKYVTSASSSNIEPVDNYNSSVGGTNSTGSKMYDVAVYRSSLVKLAGGPAYLSQSSGGITVTDHLGVGVKIELV